MSKYIFISHFAGQAWEEETRRAGTFLMFPLQKNHFLSLPGDSAAALIGINFGYTAYAGTILMLKSTAWGE